MRRLGKRNDRGASLVETALVMPVAMLLIMAIFEGALYFRAYLASEHAAQAGSRKGSILGSQVDADYYIMKSAISSTAGAAQGQIDLIMIYKVDGPDDTPDPACLAQLDQPHPQGVDNKCNIYTKDDFARPVTDFGGGGFGKDQHWNALSRVQSQTAGTDYLGVYVKAHSSSAVSGTFGLSPYMHASNVERLEATTR